jgi:hypothetical protein
LPHTCALLTNQALPPSPWGFCGGGRCGEVGRKRAEPCVAGISLHVGSADVLPHHAEEKGRLARRTRGPTPTTPSPSTWSWRNRSRFSTWWRRARSLRHHSPRRRYKFSKVSAIAALCSKQSRALPSFLQKKKFQSVWGLLVTVSGARGGGRLWR